MGKIVAIGGGEIGRPGHPIETEKIDKRIIELSGKSKPKLLFLPTASSDSEGYCRIVSRYFGKRLGCNVSHLKLLSTTLSQGEIEEKILSSDIIYVGGGNTFLLLKTWKQTGTDKILKKAHEKGVILSGLSAGAICWFKYGLSDSKRFEDESDQTMIQTKGLNLVNAAFSPHQIREDWRLFDLMGVIKRYSGIGLAVEDYCAIEIIDDKYKLITSKPHSYLFKVFKEKGRIRCEKQIPQENYQQLQDLIS